MNLRGGSRGLPRYQIGEDMPNIYKPLPDGSAWFRSFFPEGTDAGAMCAKHGWSTAMPEGVVVYDESGAILQDAAPRKGAKTAPKEQ